MPVKKKLFIFDLDGTLLDTVESLHHSVNHCLNALGLPGNPRDAYLYYAGEGAALMLKRSLAAAGDEKLVHFDELMKLYIDYFATGCLYQVLPYEGMPETLAQLKEMGIRIAVLTNKADENAHTMVETIFGLDYFDQILGQNDTHKRKPSPEGVFQIMEHLKVIKDDCVYVGDTATDMQTGKAAGILTVGVTWGFRDRRELMDNHADFIIEHPQELLKLLV